MCDTLFQGKYMWHKIAAIVQIATKTEQANILNYVLRQGRQNC